MRDARNRFVETAWRLNTEAELQERESEIQQLINSLIIEEHVQMQLEADEDTPDISGWADFSG